MPETDTQAGRPRAREDSGLCTLSIRVRPEARRQLRVAAASEELTMGEVVEKAIAFYVSRNGDA